MALQTLWILTGTVGCLSKAQQTCCAATQVMSTLKQLAQEGHTVVCSIHQPRSSIYAMFDDLVLLAEGSLVYSGKCPTMSVATLSVRQELVCMDWERHWIPTSSFNV